MIRRRGKFVKLMVLLGTAAASIAALGPDIWRREGGQRWLLPLSLFLCVTGLILLFTFTVEALAPFIYAIF